MTPLVELRNVSKEYRIRRTSGVGHESFLALDDASLSLHSGKTMSVIGESGAGKSTLAKIILGLEKPTAGNIVFKAQDMASPSSQLLRKYRSSVAAVFQDPYGSLNPRMTIGGIVGEPLMRSKSISKRERLIRVGVALERVGLDPLGVKRYPAQFSGGQRQRIAIARALINDPELVVLDEPVSALDVSVRAQVLNLLRDIQDEGNTAYLYITHDLASAEMLGDDVIVMHRGQIVESGPATKVCRHPTHPYTKSLLDAALTFHQRDLGSGTRPRDDSGYASSPPATQRVEGERLPISDPRP